MTNNGICIAVVPSVVAMRDCPECGGHGNFESCPQHGGANCPCDAYASACERCEGDGVIPVVCPECFEAEMPAAALICDACYADILLTEGAAVERQMALPFVLDAKVDALLAAAERLDEGMKDRDAQSFDENLYSILAGGES